MFSGIKMRGRELASDISKSGNIHNDEIHPRPPAGLCGPELRVRGLGRGNAALLLGSALQACGQVSYLSCVQIIYQ